MKLSKKIILAFILVASALVVSYCGSNSSGGSTFTLTGGG